MLILINPSTSSNIRSKKKKGFKRTIWKMSLACYILYRLFLVVNFNCNGSFFQVYSIRDAAANNLKRLAEEFGPEWAMQHIVPQVCFK